jgi:hypothetical protein
MKVHGLRCLLQVSAALVCFLCAIGMSLSAPLESSPGLAAEGLILWREGQCEVVDEANLKTSFLVYLGKPSIAAEAAATRKNLFSLASSQLGPGIAAPADLGKAYLILQQLAADPLDERRCRDLLRTVVKASSVIASQQNPASTEAALRRKKEILSWNVRIEKKRGNELLSESGPPRKIRQPTEQSPVASSPAAQQLQEVEHELSMMELGGEVGELQVKLEMQDLALRFLEQGDYQEAILAIRFYRGLFGEINPRMRLGSDAMSKIFPEGSEPMLGEIERLANQALASVAQSLSETTALLRANATVAASKRLVAAYAQGGRTINVLAYPSDSKIRILKQVEGEQQVRELIDKKDFDAALSKLAQIENDSSDFEGGKLHAVIESAKSLASVHLTAARQAGYEGKTDLMLAELKQSADLWPDNPELKKTIEETQAKALLQSECIGEFDRLLANQDDQEIEKEKGRFAEAFTGLPWRQAELAGVLQRFREVRQAKERARSLREFGSLVASWELANSLCAKYPEKKDLESFRLNMAHGIEELVKGLEEARALEERHPASALARYLVMRDRFPQSSSVNAGVERVSNVLMDSGKPKFH